MLYKGTWILDLELSSDDVALLGMPSGKCVATFGGVPMTGTIDPSSSGSFGPTGMVRVVGGGNGWSAPPLPQDLHSDAGLLSTPIYAATATSVGEVMGGDLAPALLGVDFVVSGSNPAMQVFGDDPWWVDLLGLTWHGPRPPAVPDPSLIVREYDPVHSKVTFSCDTLLLPGTPMVDPYLRFGAQLLVVQNVEQVFGPEGSVGWAWCGPPSIPGVASTEPTSLIADELKAATLYWTRAGFLRVYRYRLVLYQGDGPGGGPPRMALQAVTLTAGIPALLPVAPFSGVAGVVSELAPSQEVLVVFENADPSLPRVIGYGLTATLGAPLGLPLSTTHDATTELDFGVTCPLVRVGQAAVSVGLGPAATQQPLMTAEAQAALVAFLQVVLAGAPPATPPLTSPAQVMAWANLVLAAAGVAATALGLPTAATLVTKAA